MRPTGSQVAADPAGRPGRVPCDGDPVQRHANHAGGVGSGPTRWSPPTWRW